ncbi:MAG: tetratricopeptide repeat protein, partial [Candidatus Electrothrix sp. AX5]|nr:tetratricopeptide repeat protein [Candidatus Electrothrix sp. AX5]
GLRIAGRYLGSTGESAAEYLRWLEKKPFKELGDGEHQEENAALLLRRSVAQVSDDARLALAVAGTLAFAPIAREPVAAVLEDNERRARKALGELVNYGLLEKREERWQISHALIHTYARTELALSKENLERLAFYYFQYCEIQSAAGREGYIHLAAERVHYLQLMESCLDNELWQEVQVLSEAIREYLDLQGWWKEQLVALEMRLTATQQADDPRDKGICLNSLGYTCWKYGKFELALQWYEQSLSIWRERKDRQGEGVVLNNIAMIYQQQDKYEQALNYFQQSLSIRQEIDDHDGEGATLNNIGHLHYNQGDYEQALYYYEQCLPIVREVGNKIGEGSTLNNIGLTYRAQGKPSEAVEYYKQSLVIRREQGDRAGEAVTCWNLGLTYEDMGDLAKAEKHISLAVQIAEQIKSPYLEQWRDGLAHVRAMRQGA